MELAHVNNCISMHHGIIPLHFRRMRSLLFFEMANLVDDQLVVAHVVIFAPPLVVDLLLLIFLLESGVSDVMIWLWRVKEFILRLVVNLVLVHWVYVGHDS